MTLRHPASAPQARTGQSAPPPPSLGAARASGDPLRQRRGGLEGGEVGVGGSCNGAARVARAPSKFISVGVYMIPFALLLAPLPIVAAALANGSKTMEKLAEKSIDDSKANGSAHFLQSNKGGSWKWLQAAKVLLVIQLWAVVVSLLPYYITQIPDATPMQSAVIWAMLSIVILIALYVMFGSPYSAAALLIMKGLSKGSWTVDIGEFWVWMEFLWEWSSATYLYLFLVHLPCWLLCIHVLLHPCRQSESKMKQEYPYGL
ncbi:hypothetical protein SETIT_5G272700v2 [Setaria italica]|uniref:Uncharacterized protein n=1 Tax=Setaria italica TaxID=4555 RepID=A0A368R984_SETIT|nr:hypothetical protein SETIT_5G272700v2 [Setaria italica]